MVKTPFPVRLLTRAELNQFWGEPSATVVVFGLWLAVLMVVGAPTHQHPLLKLFALIWCALGFLFAIGELWRSWRNLLQPYASPRWLHAVRAVVGDEMVEQVLAALAFSRRGDPDYVIRRSDVIEEVRTERHKRREAARRARGVRLDDAGSLS